MVLLLFSSFLASGDQTHLRDVWGLPAGPSGQSDRSGCSGETGAPPNPLFCEPTARLIIGPSDPQQGNFNSSVGPDGYMLSAVTCGMSPVTSITEGLQQVPAGKGDRPHGFCFRIQTAAPLSRRSSPWDCSAPSRCSTWGASTASCGAAWFRGSSRKQPTSGSSGSPEVSTGWCPTSSSVPSSSPSVSTQP